MEKLIIWNKLIEGGGSKDNNEANTETVFKYYYWEGNIFQPTAARLYHRNSKYYDGRLLN